ncbi:hypothetical protein KP803_00400 [Vibrio sp. ZSDE26]|uniref:Uncharacterized protein n=1 Tax=Vibrio amylolyticus TaxID=2847292 RepID=A0A9X2BHV4_9VIBR|nr:hypothetical protein [Vibrio amylolyticus]MCK6261727.1 hypothetical protein [Vibrio amylolyticus]
MTRLVAIVFISALAFLLIRYRTNEKIQKGIVVTLVVSFLIYTASIMIAELAR